MKLWTSKRMKGDEGGERKERERSKQRAGFDEEGKGTMCSFPKSLLTSTCALGYPEMVVTCENNRNGIEKRKGVVNGPKKVYLAGS